MGVCVVQRQELKAIITNVGVRPPFWNRSNRKTGGVVSKETVVLRRWGSSIQKFGLSTELIM